MRKSRRLICFGLALVIILGMIAAANAEKIPEEQIQAPNNGSVSLTFGVDWTTQYFFRGIVQETNDLIVQPHLETSWRIVNRKGFFSGLDLSIGIWNSLHSGETGKGQDPEGWYEADLYSQVSLVFADLVTTGVQYTAYTSPNNMFGTIHEIAFSLAFDDQQYVSQILGQRFKGFQPSMVVAVELDGGAIGKEGTYMELGLNPQVSILDLTYLSIDLGIPLALGLGLSDYYDNETGDTDTFGFFSSGLDVSLGMAFIPPRLGNWQLVLGGRLLVLGDIPKQANNGDRTEFIVSAGLQSSY